MEDQQNKLKILIATGIYPPDIGGPATYAYNLSRELIKLDCEIKIITYADEGIKFDKLGQSIFSIDRRQSIFGRYLKYFLLVKKLSAWSDIIYVLDLVSAGFPATLAAKITKKKIIFRTGGDFLWEKAYQNGWTSLPLSKYYENKKNWCENLLMIFCRWILKRIDLIIFSTKFQAKIYEIYYGVLPIKSRILSNAFPAIKVEQGEEQYRNSIIFAGRLVEIKNLDRLVRVFANIDQAGKDLLIFGDGPEKKKLEKLITEIGAQNKIKLMGRVGHRELMNIITGCRFFILPSVSEISPNLALECVSLNKPLILTRETGLEEGIIKNLLTIDPLSDQDIEDKIRYLLDDDNLFAYADKIKQFNISWREWNQVADDHLEIFKKYASNK